MEDSFFCQLSRRNKYSMRGDGSMYSYRYYRENFQHEIAEDCNMRCVYCDCHESVMGGRDAMQIDHFRPYSIPRFEALENNPNNFHHACGRCNLLKNHHWPSTQQDFSHDGSVGFIDPFLELRAEFFCVKDDGTLEPIKPPAHYLIKLLALNRPHLKLLRRRRLQIAGFKNLLSDFQAMAALSPSDRPADFESRLASFLEACKLATDISC